MTYANIPRAPHLCLSNLGADWQKTRIIRTHVIYALRTFGARLLVFTRCPGTSFVYLFAAALVAEPGQLVLGSADQPSLAYVIRNLNILALPLREAWRARVSRDSL
jgi:hypothetical protein